jgi:cellulose synthase/poly-beta-1,6-N-acetylglucosamine synthase-like glycosyltransferase
MSDIVLAVLSVIVVWQNGCSSRCLSLFAKKEERRGDAADHQPFVTVIIPVYNEAAMIERKLREVVSFTYHSHEVLFADASDDGTSLFIDMLGDPRVRRLPCVRGRARQLNTALAFAKGEVVIVTDVDGVLPADVIEKTLRAFDASTGLVSCRVGQPYACGVDRAFWAFQEAMRDAESSVGCVPVASGVFYAFRRSLLAAIPEDVWADDIYIPFVVNTSGYCCRRAEGLVAEELRAPKKLGELFRSKVRKASDNIKESLRLFPAVVCCDRRVWQYVFFNRSAALLSGPFVFTGWVTVWGFVGFPFAPQLGVTFVIVVLCTEVVLRRRRSSFSVAHAAGAFVMTHLSLVCALACRVLGEKRFSGYAR